MTDTLEEVTSGQPRAVHEIESVVENGDDAVDEVLEFRVVRGQGREILSLKQELFGQDPPFLGEETRLA